jgi:rubrerythrin
MEHEKRYLKLLKNVETGQVFKKPSVVNGAAGTAATCTKERSPDLCPACAHPQAHYELLAENY